MSLLIATDEAGYGPRLGPLVIAATAWRRESEADWEDAARRLSEPIEIPPLGMLFVDDSKKLYRGGVENARGVGGKARLDLIAAAAAAWANSPRPDGDYRAWLSQLAPDDLEGLTQQPWFAALADSRGDPVSFGHGAVDALLSHWGGGGLRLVGIAARVIDAARFNRLLETKANKADLLSNLTCELAVRLLRRHATAEDATGEVPIFSDRHGGRARYGALLQHHCPEWWLRVVTEGNRLSEYLLMSPGGEPRRSQPSLRWRFTVGGDSYPPVAMSSVIAKSTRERLMRYFNDFFAAEWNRETNPDREPLKPTAGYAVDAERFLAQTATLRRKLAIPDERLIRAK
jgi:hypothetical protein